MKTNKEPAIRRSVMLENMIDLKDYVTLCLTFFSISLTLVQGKHSPSVTTRLVGMAKNSKLTLQTTCHRGRNNAEWKTEFEGPCSDLRMTRECPTRPPSKVGKN